MIMNYYDHFVDLSIMWCCYQCLSNKPQNFCCLMSSWKEKWCCNNLCNIRIHHSFKNICNVNKFVSFNINPKFTAGAAPQFPKWGGLEKHVFWKALSLVLPAGATMIGAKGRGKFLNSKGSISSENAKFFEYFLNYFVKILQ